MDKAALRIRLPSVKCLDKEFHTLILLFIIIEVK